MTEENIESKIYFVYCFMDTRKPDKYEFGDFIIDFEPIYIGKGKGKRPYRHYILYKTCNTRFYSKMKSIADDGFKSEFILLKENLSEEEAFIHEKNIISLIGRIENGGTLTNLTDGGEGQSGLKFSEETKKKMSITKTGKKLGKMSEEAKLNLSIAKTGIPSKLKGMKLEEIVGVEKAKEIKMKCSETGSKRIGASNGMYGKNHSEESKEKMSKNLVRKFGKDNPNYGREYTEEEKTFDTWRLTNIDGSEVVADNLNKFCRENNLNASCMRDIYYGRMRSHKGWIKVEKLSNNIKAKKSLI